MVTVKIGNKEVGLKATPLALLFYKQEFESDLIGDLVSLSVISKDPSKIDTVLLLQLVWAMNKTYNGVGKSFPNFAKWLDSLDSIDFADEQFMLEILEEAERGFFRGGASGGPKPPTK